ncbi:MAG: hypothetical protein K0V04_00700, partial [Deltaproteobacteria bacterium]|nr:hypothetical protein [Deltaproteobacteria bacterium]
MLAGRQLEQLHHPRDDGRTSDDTENLDHARTHGPRPLASVVDGVIQQRVEALQQHGGQRGGPRLLHPVERQGRLGVAGRGAIEPNRSFPHRSASGMAQDQAQAQHRQTMGGRVAPDLDHDRRHGLAQDTAAGLVGRRLDVRRQPLEALGARLRIAEAIEVGRDRVIDRASGGDRRGRGRGRLRRRGTTPQLCRYSQPEQQPQRATEDHAHGPYPSWCARMHT